MRVPKKSMIMKLQLKIGYEKTHRTLLLLLY